MLDETNILLDENVYLFDKKTGEKFLRQSEKETIRTMTYNVGTIEWE